LKGDKKMQNWTLLLGWGSPIGIGIFLICLSGTIYLLSKTEIENKRNQRKEKEKK
jgi:uncharacterized iron-regulated membrane protein